MRLPIVLNEPPNVFNRREVHKDLEKHRDLWEHTAYFFQIIGAVGLEQCDVQGIHYYVVVKPGMEDRVIELASRWKPGRLEWAGLEECPPFDQEQTKHPSRTAKVLQVSWVV
jgi:hypothetical protein